MPAVAGPRIHCVSIVTLAALTLLVAGIAGLIAVDVLYVRPQALAEAINSPEVRHAIVLSLVTTGITLVLVMAFAIPVGYALSRYRFPGSEVIEAVIDLPIVLPPVVIGVSLLVFFRTWLGQWIESLPGMRFVYTPKGIVVCQFLVSASYAIRAARASFDAVDVRLEHLALTLGCTHAGALWRVVLPMARNGLAAGAVMTWARAIGVFGPLMVFAGAVRMKTEVMPTTVYLELSVGRIEPALAVALMMVAISLVALVLIHWLGRGRRWWGT